MSADEKSLHSVGADIERAGRNGDLRTGRVALRAIPSWLKDGKFVKASLTPKQARRLATDLLIAAEKAEEKSL